MIAALKWNFDILAGDVQNAYIRVTNSGKIWTIYGAEFGSRHGMKALYGLKSAGTAFQNHLAIYMNNLGYKSCLAERDIMVLLDGEP
jgi:hypothetical protein